MTPELGNPSSVLVTGAAKRIGAAIARALAADGWHVHIHCNTSVNEARALAAELVAAGGSADVLAADLADAAACEQLFNRLNPGNPPVTLLINNASRFDYDTAASFTAEMWDRHAAINLRAPAILTRAFAAQLAPGRGGLVINLLDAKLASLNPDYFSYTVSKFGLLGLNELQARALAPTIRVNAIAPSVTLVSGPQSRENFENAHVYNPMRRGVLADHIVATVRYLIDVPTLTGEVITLDAGQRFLGMPRDVAYMIGES